MHLCINRCEDVRLYTRARVLFATIPTANVASKLLQYIIIARPGKIHLYATRNRCPRLRGSTTTGVADDGDSASTRPHRVEHAVFDAPKRTQPPQNQATLQTLRWGVAFENTYNLLITNCCVAMLLAHIELRSLVERFLSPGYCSVY